MTRTNRPVGSSATNNKQAAAAGPPTQNEKIISAAIVELFNRNLTAHYGNLN